MNLTFRLKDKGLLVVGVVLFSTVFVFAYFALADVTGSLLPSSDGAYLQWTPKTGAVHYTMVDESTCNGTTDYNYTTTVGNRDSYEVSLASISNGSTITTIEITPCASRNNNGNGSATMNVFYRFNGADSADAGNYALTGTTPAQLASTTFSGLSLAKNASSSLQIGAVLSAGTKGARLSRIAAVVTYTPPLPPTAPSNLDAVNASSTQNNLTWTDNSTNEEGFKVEQSINNQFGPFTQITTTTPNAVSYDDTGLTANQTYFYRVRAFNSAGNSGYSNTDYAITATVVPNSPSNLTATASSSNAFLAWADNSSNEEGFKMERSVDSINFTEIATKGINVTNHTDSGLTSGTYYYRTRAFNVIGNSGYSNTASTMIQ